MNGLKKKVIASAAMLLVAAVMLTSSSFAWYTISTHGDVQEITAELKATDNLEIARAKSLTQSSVDEADLDQGDAADEQIYWGTKVNDWGTANKFDMPATWSDATIKTATYSNTGRVGSLITATGPSNFDKGVAHYTATVDGNLCDVADVYCLWIRSNNSLTGDDVIKGTISNKDSKTGLKVRYRANNTGSWTDATITGNEVVFGDTAADTAYYVQIFTFIDGDEVHASDVEDGLAKNTFSIDFKSKKITDDAATAPATNSNAQAAPNI